MMIAIDPDVSVSHTTAPMNGKTWMLEFKLVIKDSATGSGKVYMDNAWTRTPDNIMGTMFYGWTKNATNVFETYNNVVIPNLEEATATVTLDETDPVMTTVTVKTNSTAFPGAAFADGDVEKTFTGRAGQEIQDYTSPVCAGYDLTGWVARMTPLRLGSRLLSARSAPRRLMLLSGPRRTTPLTSISMRATKPRSQLPKFRTTLRSPLRQALSESLATPSPVGITLMLPAIRSTQRSPVCFARSTALTSTPSGSPQWSITRSRQSTPTRHRRGCGELSHRYHGFPDEGAHRQLPRCC